MARLETVVHSDVKGFISWYKRKVEDDASTGSVIHDLYLVALTPEFAQWLLSRLGKNRTAKPGALKKLQIEVKKRGWILTTNALDIYRGSGLVGDGQHRLDVISKLPDGKYLVYMAFGMTDSQAVSTDTGIGRTPRDMCTWFDMSPELAQHVNAIYNMPNDASPQKAASEMTECIGVLDVEILTRMFKVVKPAKKQGLVRAPILAAAYRATQTIPAEKVLEWLEILTTGSPKPEHSAAVKFKDQQAANKGGDKREQANTYLRACNSILKFAAGEVVQQLPPLRSDPFPLLGELAAVRRNQKTDRRDVSGKFGAMAKDEDRWAEFL